MKYLAFILLLVVACGPAAKLRRAQKLIAKAKLEGAVAKTDTTFSKKKIKGDSTSWNIVTKDSIVVSYKDSVAVNHKDTTIYHIKHQIVYEKLDTTIVLSGIATRVRISGKKISIETKCPDKEIKVATAIKEEIVCPPADNKWKWIALTAIGLFLVTLFIAIKR